MRDFSFPWSWRRNREAARNFPMRYWEIDFARGVAVVMMVVFHFVFDLHYLGIEDNHASFAYWRPLAVCTATLFLFLVGLSLTISSARAAEILDRRAYILKFVRRGGGIFSLGLLITLVTLIFVPSAPILFGILHLIGIAVMLAPLYLPRTWENLAAGVALIVAGMGMDRISGPLSLLWLGIHPDSFASLDYTPLVPWLGVVLLGVFAGKNLYPGGRRRFNVPAAPLPGGNGVCFLGRHSLFIYVIHQPLILLVISLAWGFPASL